MTVVTRKSIESGLRRMGLGEGDIVLLHSSLASLGDVDGGPEAVIEAFLAVLGTEGTLVVPTFGALGIITERVRERGDAVRSIHPKASVAAIGAAAEAICRNHWKADRAHGPDTPYKRIADMGGYVCLLGVDEDRNTTLHTVEEMLRLPYLKTTADVTFDTPEGPVTRAWEHFPGPHRNFIGIERALQGRSPVRVSRLGTATMRLMKSADLIECATALGRQDPAFALCDNPACRDCILQRADIRRDRYARECFSVATATSLAGTYAEEIVDVCACAGIGQVEIDLLNGMPLTRLPTSKLEKAVDVFREGGLTVRALRVPAVTDSIGSLLEFAAAATIPRVVMPLSVKASQVVERGADMDVTVSFSNRAMAHGIVSEIMLSLRSRGLPANLTFSPAEFAAAGENPFLTSYRGRLRRFIDQIDVADALFDGTPRPLGQGNGEIKELISALRCCSFGGLMVLGAGNRFCGSLAAAATAFDQLLDAM